MKGDRLLSALLLLQAHRRLSSRELARRLEVCERTVHRDMEALSASGVPVFALRGSRGGWQLDEQWRTRVPGLEESELRALLMVQPRAVGHPRLAATAERALTKLIAAMPLPLRRQAASIQERLHVDPTGWRGTVEDLSSLSVVQEAVSGDRMLRIRYQQPGHPPTERTIHPLGLVAKGTTWYLVARTPQGLRTYRVSRIQNATMLDARFERPPDFDLAAHWRASTEQFRQRQGYVTTLRVEPAAADALQTWCRVIAAEPPAGRDRGRVTIQVRFGDESEARFMVLGFGTRVEVVAPVGLRRRVAREIATMFGRIQHRARGGHRR